MRRIKNKINFETRALESDPNKGIKIKSYIDGLKKALSIIDGSKQWNSFEEIYPVDGQVVLVRTKSGVYNVVRYSVRLDFESVCDYWMEIPKIKC